MTTRFCSIMAKMNNNLTKDLDSSKNKTNKFPGCVVTYFNQEGASLAAVCDNIKLELIHHVNAAIVPSESKTNPCLASFPLERERKSSCRGAYFYYEDEKISSNVLSAKQVKGGEGERSTDAKIRATYVMKFLKASW